MKPDTIVVHYSATFPGQKSTVIPGQPLRIADIDQWHRQRGFKMVGYHWFVGEDALVEEGRVEGTQGAGVPRHNSARFIHICYAGGLEKETGPDVGRWNPNPKQEAALINLINEIIARHPTIKNVVGHVDLNPSQCPGLPKGGIASWWAEKGGKVRSMASSRTMQGSAVATAGVGGQVLAEATESVAMLLPYADSLKWIFIGLTLAGVAYAAYARYDDWKKGRI
jgi:N-acetylmuramoyl-L-alanine amidase